MTMSEGSKHVFNLCNSIIGVSLLAMPFCFKRCGIILGIVMVLASGFLTRFTSHLLMKASLLSRKSNYEVLAFHVYGPLGKFIVEASVICFMLGVLVSFFVIIGDIAPDIVLELSGIEAFPALRTVVLTAIGLSVGLPLGLLRNLSSLGPISTLAMTFYAFLALKIISDALPVLMAEDWTESVLWWEPEGILVCLPIFSLALACQTQLFEVYEVLHEPSLGKMNKLVKQAVNICACGYITVGFFGYIAFYNTDFSGNILMAMQPSLVAQLIKLAFTASVVCSIPLVVLPCRTSLYSLLYRRNYTPIEVGPTRVNNDVQFRVTTVIVVFPLIMGVMFPNIELVLELNGSTIGTIICLIFPAILFIRVTSRNTFERTGAQLVFCAGIFIFVVCTYISLRHAVMPITTQKAVESIILEPRPSLDSRLPDIRLKSERPVPKVLTVDQDSIKIKEVYDLPKLKPIDVGEKKVEKVKEAEVQYVRQEPPIPQEPEAVKAVIEEKKEIKVEQPGDPLKQEEQKVAADTKPVTVVVVTESGFKQTKVDVGAKQEELLQKLQAQQEEQKKLIQQQKQLLEELKAHKDTHFKDADLGPSPDKIKNEKKYPVLPNIVLEPVIPLQKSDETQNKVGVVLPLKKQEQQSKDDRIVNRKNVNMVISNTQKEIVPSSREDLIPSQNIKTSIPQQKVPPVIKQEKEIKQVLKQYVDGEMTLPSAKQSLLIPLVQATNASNKTVVADDGTNLDVKHTVLKLGIPADSQALRDVHMEDSNQKGVPNVKKLYPVPVKDETGIKSIALPERKSQEEHAEIRKREAIYEESDQKCESTKVSDLDKLPDADKLGPKSQDDKRVERKSRVESNKSLQVQTNKMDPASSIIDVNLSRQHPGNFPPSRLHATTFPSKVHGNALSPNDADSLRLRSTYSANRALKKDEQR